MKNKKGFTLVELLAVIVVLSVILVIATTNVMQSINDSKNKAKYIAAKEIVEIGSAYLYEKPDVDNCYSINELTSAGYLEEDVTNPKTGDNSWTNKSKQGVCKCESCTEQSDYELKQEGTKSFYYFDGYKYYINQ